MQLAPSLVCSLSWDNTAVNKVAGGCRHGGDKKCATHRRLLKRGRRRKGEVGGWRIEVCTKSQGYHLQEDTVQKANLNFGGKGRMWYWGKIHQLKDMHQIEFRTLSCPLWRLIRTPSKADIGVMGCVFIQPGSGWSWCLHPTLRRTQPSSMEGKLPHCELWTSVESLLQGTTRLQVFLQTRLETYLGHWSSELTI